jgi:hypothetical protein
MRKAILLMLLAVVSSSAAAEWVRIGGGGSTTTYADPAAVHKVGDIVEMWNLFDFKAARNDYFSPSELLLSQRVNAEYDCKTGRTRIRSIVGHSGSMGTGDAVYTVFDIGEWEPVPPDTIVRTLWTTACGK